MFNTSVMLGLAIGLVCVFVALALFVSRITSVREDTANEIERVNTRYDILSDRLQRLEKSNYTLLKRVEKLEDSKVCILDSGTDEVRETSLYAITKVGYSTIVVSLTEDELAVIDSFIDWAELDEDFSAEKLDQDYTPVVWRNKE